MRKPLICTVWLLGVAVVAVGCGGKRTPEQWQTYMNQREQEKEAGRPQAARNNGVRSTNLMVSECRDGGSRYDYVCKRTYDVGSAHTTETVGYTLSGSHMATMQVLTQTHTCPDGSVRPGNPGC
jgi:hypothetical protein